MTPHEKKLHKYGQILDYSNELFSNQFGARRMKTQTTQLEVKSPKGKAATDGQ
jgi:hypothetical protein